MGFRAREGDNEIGRGTGALGAKSMLQPQALAEAETQYRDLLVVLILVLNISAPTFRNLEPTTNFKPLNLLRLPQ